MYIYIYIYVYNTDRFGYCMLYRCHLIVYIVCMIFDMYGYFDVDIDTLDSTYYMMICIFKLLGVTFLLLTVSM